MKIRRPRVHKPQGPVLVDRGNAFGSRVRILAYPLGDRQIWEAVKGTVYTQTAGGAGVPSVWGQSYRNNATGGIIRTEACPADLLSTKSQTIISVLHGRAASWNGRRVGRLFDVSSGSGFGLTVEYQSSSNIILTSHSFASVGTSKSFVCDPLAPLVVGTSIVSSGGAAIASMFVNGIFVDIDTITADAAAAGADTRVEVMGDNGNSVDYGMTMWLAGALTANEMAELMENPWQVLMPRHVFVSPTVAPSFNPAWAGAANTVIQSGVRAA